VGEDKLKVDEATRLAVLTASNPRASAWVSANAGSGKTFVLSRRVIRLLLDGVDPARILCLTFTKAAAAEMAKRVFDTLASWTGMSDAKLTAELTKIEGEPPLREHLARARRLFARALETPGGLKIQTIHAFCERLLHQFPFEANVAGHFEVAGDRVEAAMIADARRAVLANADAEPDGRLGLALRTVLAASSDMFFEAALAEFIRKRDVIRGWLDQDASVEAAAPRLRAALGLAPGETESSLRRRLLNEAAFDEADIARLLSALRASGGKRDGEAAERLAPCIEADDPEVRIDAWLDFFQTKKNSRWREISAIVTKKIKADWDGLEARLERELARLKDLTDRLLAVRCFENSIAMLTLADAAIDEYERQKRARGLLDFEDLIVRTAMLLRSRSEAAAWVHYKLDRGIDHILVDEAQDTNPRQWQVVRALAEEFFAGQGATDSVRTLFAVGDEKQSIYSFQGAVPAWFGETARELGGRARAAGYVWERVGLHLSFRSAQIVLDAVDTVFADETVRAGVTGDWLPHGAARMTMPGRVEIWPMIEPDEREETDDWAAPLDKLDEKSPEVKLAQRIAREVRRLLDSREVLASTGKPVEPRDILVLSRIRGAQTDAINSALKNLGVVIAGADRVTLSEQIAVMDLLALGRVVLLPEDDLSLASLLKSPLVGLDEDQLYRLAHGRKGSLWDALGALASTDQTFARARAAIEDWRARVDYLDPHGFFARVLGPGKARRRFVARLGPEADDVIDEFLAAALDYERRETPSMEGFLAWFAGDDIDVRRDVDLARNEVRVMTVHGAKGLEAAVVFLVDTGSAPTHNSHDPRMVPLGGEGPETTPEGVVWMSGQRAMPELVSAHIDVLRQRAEEEYRRLLYVGMTRAKERLVVCGTTKNIPKDDRPSIWHALVTRALEPRCEQVVDADGTVVTLLWRPDPAATTPTAIPEEATSGSATLESWALALAPPAPVPLRRVSPSTLLAGDTEFAAARVASAAADRVASDALERGKLIHRLLQSLPDHPREYRRTVAAAFLAADNARRSEEDRMPDDVILAILEEVLRVLDVPSFAPVFAEGSRAEVDIAGRVKVGGIPALVSGRIDRLAVTPENVLIVDYKTNRPAPSSLAETPPAYVVQLALYRNVLSQLYPGRTVAAAILWTDSATLMEVPAESMDSAMVTVAAA
jgi:ATP-dependent helicase/nuclease subunit A